jgi:hypothetical protein
MLESFKLQNGLYRRPNLEVHLSWLLLQTI